ncbi:MAG: Crp/Fnr family transcriptional regulator [Chromatiales bacterium]|nr:Crp/Fnr family transcriptional regulator [Chromatiales bacterium]
MANPAITGGLQRRLLKLFADLDARDQETVLALVEVLAGRRQANAEVASAVPVLTPRPESETVVGAMRRLSGDYTMLNTDDLLHEASALMSEHMLQGRDGADVITALETLFARHYTKRFGAPKG